LAQLYNYRLMAVTVAYASVITYVLRRTV